MPPTPSTDDLTPQSAHLLLASLRNLRTSLTHTLDRLDATILRVHARAALSTLPPQAALGNPSHAPETAPHISGNGPGGQPVEARMQTDPWVLRAQTVENRIMRLRQTARELRERAEASDGRALPDPLGQEPAGRVMESANNDVNGSQSISAFIDSIRQDQAQVENGMRRLDALSTHLISQRPNSSSAVVNDINMSSRPTSNVIRPSTPRLYNHPRGLVPTNNLYAYPDPERVASNNVSGRRASSTASTVRASDGDYFESGNAGPNFGSRTYSPPRIVSNVQRENGEVDNQSFETLEWRGNSPSIRSVSTLSRNVGNREFDFRSLFDFPLESPVPFVGVPSSNIRTRDVNNGGNAAEDSLTRRGRTVHQRMNNSQPQPQPQPQLPQSGIVPDIHELRRFNEVNEQPSFLRPMTERFSLSSLEANALRRLGSQERPSSAELQMVPFRSVSDDADPSRHGSARPDTGTTQSPGLNSTSLPFNQSTLPPRTTQSRDDTTFEERMERIRNARASLRQVSQLRRDMRTVRRGPPPAPGMGMAEPPVASVDTTGSREIQAPLTRDSDVNQDPRRRNSTANSSPHTRLTPSANNRLQLDPTDPTDPWNNDTSFQGAMETLHNALAGELERRHWVVQSEMVDGNDGERRRDRDLVDDGIGLDVLVLEVGVAEQRPTPAQNVAAADVGSTPAGDAMVRSEGERGEELPEDNADEDQEDQDEEQVSRERRDIGLSSRRVSMKECYQVDLHLWPGMTGWGDKRKEGTSCREVTIEPLQFTV
ncbi:hypothetical protein CND05000 [Cryptococcus gattii WM276]|uniref:Uncharacterized protein n=1 Tax=Cryptococcus gattii serotype B (strain WM276 / ATCC MYA-4071) TaxID=367775 RepID=E6RC08_CRYGW|nr:uncharacterized protein CGB_I2070W [Cryptococcus gattii WM276]ADV24327.1 hypothetical protein CND05000 [Cryptococcus gattii WM276]